MAWQKNTVRRKAKTVKLPLRGPVEYTARDILGGLRSACTYVGASRLKELTGNAQRLFAFRNRKTAFSIACNTAGWRMSVRQHYSVLSRTRSIPRWSCREYIATTSDADNRPVAINNSGSRRNQIVCLLKNVCSVWWRARFANIIKRTAISPVRIAVGTNGYGNRCLLKG